jgi:monoamine oxidase
VHLADGTALQADKAVVCIPPQLAAAQIEFDPAMPEALATLLPTVQTWMAGSIKFAIEYEQPFWRHKGFSGMLYSHAGMVAEMYDHTNVEETRFGFTGFLHGGAANYDAGVRKEYVLRQLGELLGEEAMNPVAYVDKVWTGEYIAEGTVAIQRPHQNNGHPLLQQAYLDCRLFFGATETAATFAGYMDGAVEAAMRVADAIG